MIYAALALDILQAFSVAVIALTYWRFSRSR